MKRIAKESAAHVVVMTIAGAFGVSLIPLVYGCCEWLAVKFGIC